MKKVLLSVLTVLLVISCALFVACNDKTDGNDNENVVPEKQTPMLVDKELNLYVGDTYTFSIKGEDYIEYSVSDESVAAVSDNGVLTALKDGTAFVTVRGESFNDSLRVNVAAKDDAIRFSAYEVAFATGGSKTVTAEVVRRGKVTSEKITFTCNSENMTVKANGNEVTVYSSVIGNYELVATCGELTVTCKVKVVNPNAIPLDKPTLEVSGCKTLGWAAVTGASNYRVIVNGKEIGAVTGTEIDVSAYTADLKNGETATMSVRAEATDNFDYIDGVYSTYVFSHKFVENVIKTSDKPCAEPSEIGYECSVCHKNYVDSEYYAPHNIVDGACTVCGKIVTEKILYNYDELNDCYFVAGADAGFNAEDVYILAEYNDGKHGKKAVKYFAQGAFQANKAIKRVYIPASITEFEDKRPEYNVVVINGKKLSTPLRGLTFDECENLEFVSAIGMRSFPAIAGYVIVDKNGQFIRIGGATNDDDKSKGYSVKTVNYEHDNFRDCYRLKTIIVAENFDNDGRTFMKWIHSPDSYVPVTDVYVYGAKINKIASDGYAIGATDDSNNNLLTGDVFCYDETSTDTDCYKWHFAADGQTVISGGKHEYNRKGVCRKCGARNSFGINYAFDASAKTYYVADNKTYKDSEVTILDEYDDGVNGVYPVTYVQNNAFASNAKIKRVSLPSTVTSLDGGVFLNCSNLEYISMTGIKEMPVVAVNRPYGTVATNNNFLNCGKLSVVIVGKEFDLSGQQFKKWGIEEFVGVDIYVDGDEKTSEINAVSNGQNDLLTGAILYKGETNTCFRWNYDEDGDIVVSSKSHDFVNGKCIVCGKYDDGGFTYSFDPDKKEYTIKSYVGKKDVLTVPAMFDDGTNGEYPVTAIGEGAFRENNAVKFVTLPASVTKIGSDAFHKCTELVQIVMTGVTELGYGNAFLNCHKLTRVVVGKNFTLNGQAFVTTDGVKALTEFYVYGSQSESRVVIGTAGNNNLLTGKVYYYSDKLEKDCWHYVDGVATLWA